MGLEGLLVICSLGDLSLSEGPVCFPLPWSPGDLSLTPVPGNLGLPEVPDDLPLPGPGEEPLPEDSGGNFPRSSDP